MFIVSIIVCHGENNTAVGKLMAGLWAAMWQKNQAARLKGTLQILKWNL